MTKEELMARIDSAKHQAMTDKQREINSQIRKFNELYSRAKEYCKEIPDLLDLLNYALKNGYRIQAHSSFIGGYKDNECPRLETDGIDHTLGFYRDRDKGYAYVGIENGGYRGNIDLLADGNDIYWGRFGSMPNYDPTEMLFYRSYVWGDAYGNLEQFTKKFPEFRDKVYDFIENIGKYKCFS